MVTDGDAWMGWRDARVGVCDGGRSVAAGTRDLELRAGGVLCACGGNGGGRRGESFAVALYRTARKGRPEEEDKPRNGGETSRDH
jgi:hypothetical protein